MARLRALVDEKPKTSLATPPPRVKAPTPNPKPHVSPKPSDVTESSEPNAEPSEEARMARLRRLCEKKPSGRCHVPEAVHLRWKNGSRGDREELLEELEKSGWSKDPSQT